MITEDQAWQKAIEALKAYNEECNKHNKEIMEQVVAKVGNKALEDFKELMQLANVTGKLEIVSEPGGEVAQNESYGVFTEVWVDQRSVGMEGDSFEGFVYGKFADAEWLKIPYSC